jgi:2,4-dienoyl-CoA reductase-like NADH-dependent reductase (Old Yellow Enzyme family)
MTTEGTKKNGRGSYRIFSEGAIGGKKTKNRLVRSATFEAGGTHDGTVTDTYVDFYRTLAHGGVGTIITGWMSVAANGRSMHNHIGIWEDYFISGIKKAADAVHREAPGTVLIAQIGHAGRNIVSKNDMSEPVGPSAVPLPILKKRARALTLEEIEKIVEQSIDAIARVREAGFDGVQLHGAHGYLLSSFLSPYTNRRTDRFGGSLENRVRIVSDIVSGARKRVGPDFPILIKVNADDFMPGGIDINTFPALAQKIEASGFDAIEVSGGTWDCLARTEQELGFFPVPLAESRIRIDDPAMQSYFLPYTMVLDLKIPVILVGGNRSVERMEAILKNSPVDFLSLARPLISEPDLPNRWLSGIGPETARCQSCNACFLTLTKGPVHCLAPKKLTHAMVKRIVPRMWKLMFN